MKKTACVLSVLVIFLAACNNDSTKPALMEDSAKVVLPAKQQDSMSLTDTNYRIGDSIK